jgi:hypothetical protein
MYLELLTVRKGILDRLSVLSGTACGPVLLFLFRIQGQVASLFLDHTHNLLFSAGVEDVARLAK